MPANSYLLVFASGKDRTNATGELHTGFQLSSSGGFLALVDPATNIVSSFPPTYPSQRTDVSYGRAQGAPGVVGYFTVPTPGGPNSSVGAGFAPKVEFAVNGGTYTAAFALELWTASSNAAKITSHNQPATPWRGLKIVIATTNKMTGEITARLKPFS